MSQYDLLDLFEELRSVKVFVTRTDGERLSLNGSAFLRERPYLEVSFPSEAWPALNTVDEQSQILICLENDDSVVFISTTLALEAGEGKWLLVASDYAQKSQKRSAPRVAANECSVSYWYVDEQGRQKSAPQQAQAIDISSTGVLMHMQEVVEPFRFVGLSFVIPGSSETIQCIGRIVRLALKADGSIEAAVHFTDIDKRDRNRVTDFCSGENATPCQE